MGDTRDELDKELERTIYGYVDEFPPIPGSYKAESLALARRARDAGVPDSVAIEPIKAAVERMHRQAEVFIGKLVGQWKRP